MPNCIYCKKETKIKNVCKSCSNKRRPKITEITREKMVLGKLKENNPMWKGDNVGYNSLHEWVNNNFQKPKLCQCCHKVPPIDLANKGVYNRDLKNWEWLCRSCHMKKDGRLKSLHEGNKKV
jgi:hypothetical protein